MSTRPLASIVLVFAATAAASADDSAAPSPPPSPPLPAPPAAPPASPATSPASPATSPASPAATSSPVPTDEEEGEPKLSLPTEADRLAWQRSGFRLGLGLAYEQQGDTASAIRALRKYLKLAPNAADRAIISRRIERLSRHGGTK